MCAITTCSNELLFPVKNSPESTCCSLKITHPDQIVSLHGSYRIFTHAHALLSGWNVAQNHAINFQCALTDTLYLGKDAFT